MIRSYLQYLILDKCITMLFGGVFHHFMVGTQGTLMGWQVNDGHIGKFATISDIGDVKEIIAEGIILKAPNDPFHQYFLRCKSNGSQYKFIICDWNQLTIRENG